MRVLVALHGRAGGACVDQRGAAGRAADEALEHPLDRLVVARVGQGFRAALQLLPDGGKGVGVDDRFKPAVDQNGVVVAFLGAARIVDFAVLAPPDLPDVNRVEKQIAQPAVIRSGAAPRADALGVELPRDLRQTFTGQKVGEDPAHGVGLGVRDVSLPAHVIAEGRDGHDLMAGDLLSHAALDLAGQADAVKLIHPLNDALDQGSERRIVQRLGDGDHVHAELFEHGFIDDALLLVAGETRVFPDKDEVKGAGPVFGHADHVLEGRALLRAAAGDAVLDEDKLLRHVQVMPGGVFADQLELGIKGVFVLFFGGDADVSCGGFHKNHLQSKNLDAECEKEGIV